MNEGLLKKILISAGVKDVTPDVLKAVSQAAQTNPPASLAPTSPSAGASSPDAVKSGLTNPGVDKIKLRAFADMEAARRSEAADKLMRVPSRRPNDAKYKREVYKELGLAAPEDSSGAKFGAQSENRIAPQKEKNQAAQAEASRRDGIRDSNSVDISKNISAGLTGRQIFQDKDGKVEGPAELKARLMTEGADIGTATIAAGERYRDMFDLPNAKSEGFGMRGGQRDAVINAPKGLRGDGTSPRMDVMAKLKDARANNLKSLTEQRLADPNRKSVGMITSIESSDGRVLAKRGEGEAVVARGGTQGAMGGTEDRPGALTLTRAGEHAIRDRLTVAKTEGGGTVVTGRYGTAMSGPKSTTDQLKERGLIAKDFQLTPEQKTGQAPLPKEYAKGREKLLADAKQRVRQQTTLEGAAELEKSAADKLSGVQTEIAENDKAGTGVAADLREREKVAIGEYANAQKNFANVQRNPNAGVVGDAKPLLDRTAPGTAQAVDQKYDWIAANLKQEESDEIANAFLNTAASKGIKSTPKPGAESPGPRTPQETEAQLQYLQKHAPEKAEEIRKRSAQQRRWAWRGI